MASAVANGQCPASIVGRQAPRLPHRCHQRRQHRQLEGLQQPCQPQQHRTACCSSSSSNEAASDTTCAAATPAAGSDLFSSATCMEDVYELLTERVVQALQGRDPSQNSSPYLVGVAGVPGSGKSSLARAVCARLEAKGVPAANVPMDGFHFYRRQLDQMPDAELAHARRGAEWTFDARAYHACLATIKSTGEALAPSFDHGVGDPVAGDIAVGRHHRVVVSEGNYLLLPAEPWWRLGELFDDSWYIDCSIDEAMQRVYARQTGNGVAPEVSRWRIAANDRPNAEQIQTSEQRAALAVPTLPLKLAGS